MCDFQLTASDVRLNEDSEWEDWRGHELARALRGSTYRSWIILSWLSVQSFSFIESCSPGPVLPVKY